MVSEPALPSFDRPPLNEVALSVQFEPLPGLNPAEIGVFWKTLRDRFPRVECHTPIGTTIERTGVVPMAPTRPVFVEELPAPRFWFLDEAGAELVQVQQDRFVRNWRRVDPSQSYPRYEKHTRPNFLDDYNAFLAFLSGEGIPVPVPNQCEVNYVNMIEAGVGWKSYADLGKVLRIGIMQVPSLPDLAFEEGRMALKHRILAPDNTFQGRLHISVEPRLKKSDSSPVIALTLTARGQPLSDGVGGVLAFFDLARRIIVNTFAAITTSEMHKVWGRRDVR